MRYDVVYIIIHRKVSEIKSEPTASIFRKKGMIQRIFYLEGKGADSSDKSISSNKIIQLHIQEDRNLRFFSYLHISLF
jgi:hypothetical protein